MNLLVTGAAGYIGSHFCKSAFLASHSLFGIDDLSIGERNLENWVNFQECSILETEKIHKICLENNIEGIVHFAGRSLVRESFERPELYTEINVHGTESLIKAAEATGIEYFVFSSSAAIYGEPDVEYITEDCVQNPVNPYGQTKLQCESLLLSQKNLRVAILRYFNVTGQDADCGTPKRLEPEAHIVPRISQALDLDNVFDVYGTDYPTEDGTCIRDYVDVTDLALVHLAALIHLQNNSEPLISNVGRGQGESVTEVLKHYKKIFGRLPKIEMKDRIPGNPSRLVASDKFFRTWCDVPLRSLEESLENLKRLQL